MIWGLDVKERPKLELLYGPDYEEAKEKVKNYKIPEDITKVILIRVSLSKIC